MQHVVLLCTMLHCVATSMLHKRTHACALRATCKVLSGTRPRAKDQVAHRRVRRDTAAIGHCAAPRTADGKGHRVSSVPFGAVQLRLHASRPPRAKREGTEYLVGYCIVAATSARIGGASGSTRSLRRPRRTGYGVLSRNMSRHVATLPWRNLLGYAATRVRTSASRRTRPRRAGHPQLRPRSPPPKGRMGQRCLAAAAAAAGRAVRP